MRDPDKEQIALGCIYGQYSSLDRFSLENIKYVGMTGTIRKTVTSQAIAQERLDLHLQDTPEKCGNPEKVEWYRAVEFAGGTVLNYILDEVQNSTRTELGELENQWIVKLGGPMVGGVIVQLFNKTYGRDGGWCVDHDEEWIEAARQRMIDRYADDEVRKAHGNKIRQIWAERPELRENQRIIQREIQNRPERLEQNRQQSLANWQDPEYRAKIEVPTDCPYCGETFIAARTTAMHSRRCIQNPDRDPGITCTFCDKPYLEIEHHEARCKRNPDRIAAPRGPRDKIDCPICGAECGVGAGLKAHVKWNHDQPIIRAPKDDLSTARKKMWDNFTPDERQIRIAKSANALKNQSHWQCAECDLTSTGAGVSNHQRLSGHSGRVAPERDE